jgi:hypothetical protein
LQKKLQAGYRQLLRDRFLATILATGTMGSNKKIVLVIPYSHTHYVVLPIGLGYLATALRRAGFTDVHILDCLKEGIKIKQLVKKLISWQSAVVGFQVISYEAVFITAVGFAFPAWRVQNLGAEAGSVFGCKS